jgi:sterol desaturase/sphingolipid hydroxylase (fatty acid hydroxylase superfamily)
VPGACNCERLQDQARLSEMLDRLPYVAAAIMMLAVAVEFGVSRFIRRDGKHHTRDSATAVFLAVGYFFSALVRGVVLGGIYIWLYRRAPWHWDSYDPLSMLSCLLVIDFFHYWSHRASHASKFLWAFHAVHHSSRHFNLTLGLRNSWIGGFLDWVFIAPAAIIGFHPLLIAAVIAVMSFWDFMAHTPYVGRLPIIDQFFNSPSNHRVHHSLAAENQHRNFGGMLFFWDRLFGTYQREASHTLEYGIEPAPLRPYNPFYLEVFLLPGFRTWLAPKHK